MVSIISLNRIPENVGCYDPEKAKNRGATELLCRGLCFLSVFLMPNAVLNFYYTTSKSANESFLLPKSDWGLILQAIFENRSNLFSHLGPIKGV